MINSGLLLINKIAGVSSFDVIRDLRRSLHIRKMGHGGTLDPAATGLMVVAVGQATRILNHIPTDRKTYEFGIHFGETRDTGDRDGDIVGSGFRVPSEDEITSVMPNFIGEIEQTPPKYSAVKIDGKRAYNLARDGVDFKIKSKKVTIYSLELLDFNHKTGEAKCVVDCSSGTYVRSLAADIAISLNSGAFASYINRTVVGSFTIEDSKLISEITSTDDLIPPQQLLPWESLSFVGNDLFLLKNGNSIKTTNKDVDYIWVENGEINSLLALAKIENGVLKPIKVFTE